MRARTRLIQRPFRPFEALAGFIAGLEVDGAAVSSLTWRAAGAEERVVTGLFLDSHPA